ncbi:hypothetical protein HRJ45_12155 [Vibrio coralliilyticus]|uniref:Uncharacterized protein n=1 Tax=Vibrio coralliilyticus TaxID=190893 RepID=A0AAP6ZPD5_9VIBR|nr:hypothetical protein [Vibrio coralliilyticus]NOJ25745.1 hypothetical protein [Vibrio coralliilyticus]NRF25511.1 hypothetical protein [Vibrio coralliilyticus]NRF79862.1 hypothetical protein [Vibrio coralliilyticus]
MAILFELALIILPLFTLLSTVNGVIKYRSARLILGVSFICLLVELFVSWLWVFRIVELTDLEMSIFVGHDWWNLAAGPLVFLLYLYVFTELNFSNRKKEKTDDLPRAE